MVLPSGLKLALKTEEECPLRVRNSSPVLASHTLRVWSSEAETMVLPSGLKLALKTLEECPLRVRNSGRISLMAVSKA